jgi:hypothetical protein
MAALSNTGRKRVGGTFVIASSSDTLEWALRWYEIGESFLTVYTIDLASPQRCRGETDSLKRKFYMASK